MIEIRRTALFDRWLDGLKDQHAQHKMETRKRSAPPATVPARKTETVPYDTADYLNTDEDRIGLLEAALEDGHPQVIAEALGAIARSQGMARIAKETGLNREGLYKTLSAEGNPELATLLKVIKALGLRLHAGPANG
jgi:probable addiction module antidote protein